MKINLTPLVLIFLAVCLLLGVSLASSYAPQDFAEGEEIKAQIAAQTAHLQEMNALTEQAQANANQNAYTRRGYWTLAVMFIAAAVCAVVFIGAASGGVVIGTWGFRHGLAQLAEAKYQWRAIQARPQINQLPDARFTYLTPGGQVFYVDRLGWQRLMGANTEGNAEQLELLTAQLQSAAAVEMAKGKGRVEVFDGK